MELLTKRFLLRDFVEADLPAFEAYHDDPRSKEFCSEEQAESQHARDLVKLFNRWAKARPRLNYQLAIVLRDESQDLVGCCGLRRDESDPGTAELGIELAPDYWGRYGYAVEVMRVLVEFGFNDLELDEIYGDTVSANARIARLVHFFGATAKTQATPDWMKKRGWSTVRWRIARTQWKGQSFYKRAE